MTLLEKINVAIGSLNKIKLPDWLGGFGVNISYVPYIPKINYNAEGVLFNKPTLPTWRQGLQMVGEAGAEITAPLAKLENMMVNAALGKNKRLNKASSRLI